MRQDVNGCADCGRAKRFHAISWSETLSYHQWIEPSNQQRKSRFIANFATKTTYEPNH